MKRFPTPRWNQFHCRLPLGGTVLKYVGSLLDMAVAVISLLGDQDEVVALVHVTDALGTPVEVPDSVVGARNQISTDLILAARNNPTTLVLAM